MRGRASLILGVSVLAAPNLGCAAVDVLAQPPSDIAVTVYRDPNRHAGAIDLDRLNGFALVSEKRSVHLPAGETRLRFTGVADGIEPASAIVTGLPEGVIEKNRDARLLSPEALVESAVGQPVELLRSDRKTGKTERLAGTILSDAQGGVVFKTAQGIEALRCSGLPETFDFEPTGNLSASPTLSVLIRTSAPLDAQVTLSYLSRGFDWAANYTATLSASGNSLDLGAWVTLANGNGVGFPAAHTQVVAGTVNREDDQVEPIDPGGPILAQCWPRGSTSDLPMLLFKNHATDFDARSVAAPMAMRAMALQEMTLGAGRVQQEQLGDLKLYRVPQATTVASRQSKQVRLMDQYAVPVSTVYSAVLAVQDSAQPIRVSRLLRTKNTAANHLGLPLPSGSVAIFARTQDSTLLLHESALRDIALNEDLEIDMGFASDVQLAAQKENTSVDAAHAELLPLLPGATVLRVVKVDDVNRVKISNASAAAVQFELRLQLPEGASVVRADHPLGAKNGRPMFALTIPANDSVTLRFQTQRSSANAVLLR